MLFVTAMFCTNTNAQTFKYRLVKIVDRNTGAENDPGVQVIFLTFYNNYGSFAFTNQNGQLENNYLSYMNFKPAGVSYTNGLGGSIASGTSYFNKREFNYVGLDNGNKKYICRRGAYDENNNYRLAGYINDYIFFSSDYKRFNIYSGGTPLENGILHHYGGSTFELCPSSQIYVYERVDNSPAPGGVLY